MGGRCLHAKQREIIKEGVDIALGAPADGCEHRFDRQNNSIQPRGQNRPPSKIELGCDLASRGVDAVVTIALHELGHALGLGHADFEEYDGVKELMYPTLRQFTYPSTLDFYAIYQLVIGGYSGSSLSLPEWLPYAQVSPQSLVYPEVGEGGGEVGREEAAALTELEKRVSDLSDKLSSLENKVLGFEDYVQLIEERVGELEERVSALGNSSLELRRWANETETALAKCFEAFSRLNDSISRLSDEMAGQSEHFERKIAELTMNLEKLRSSLNEASSKWSENFKSIMERQDALDERLGRQEEHGQVLDARSEQIRGEVELLKLRILELEESLEERDMRIMRLQNLSAILSIMLAAALIIAIVGFVQASRARKAMKSVNS